MWVLINNDNKQKIIVVDNPNWGDECVYCFVLFDGGWIDLREERERKERVLERDKRERPRGRATSAAKIYGLF